MLWGRGAFAVWGTNPPHNFHVCSAGAVAWSDGVDYAQDVPLHHADEVEVVFALGHVAEVLDEVHDVCAVVHGVLGARGISSLESRVCGRGS